MILPVLATRLLAALSAAHPDTVALTAGPTHEPRSEQDELVVVAANQLTVAQEPTQGDDDTRRGPASHDTRHRWPADGNTQDFSLPESTTGQLIEVESPPGHRQQRGDDYEFSDRTIKFYRPPAASGEAVVATVRGDRAQGYQDKRRCDIDLTITAWAKTAQRADQLLTTSLSAVLAASVNLGNLEADTPDDAAVRMRLVQPHTVLTNLSRSAETIGQAEYLRAAAHLCVSGELDLTVALGAPLAAGTIDRIETTYQTLVDHDRGINRPQ